MSKKALIEAQDTVTAVQNAMLRVANLPKSGNVRGVSGCGRLALDKGIWTFAPGQPLTQAKDGMGVKPGICYHDETEVPLTKRSMPGKRVALGGTGKKVSRCSLG
eukprot:TRINITY_DN82975_c0_g1_i1.p1 TRINITY_DN82975_c0_g1~~TRINITY_DN82975_c0_g1_i1.p1  ORF type:complete len:105 (+),score=10.16 TRINITY_DN82975_c0_g1_i1:166-480(+)